MQNNNHILWIDYIKCLCLMLVIIYHSMDVWEVSPIASMLSLCIPPFFMLNGWLMFRKDRPYLPLVKKSVKVFVITTIWALFNGLSTQLYEHMPLSVGQMVGWVTSRSHDGYCHTLWFMDTFLILTLLCPLTAHVIQKAENKRNQLFLFLFLVCVTFVPKIGYHLHLSFFDGWMSYSLAYFVGGYLLMTNVIDVRKVKSWMLFAIMVIAIFMQTAYNYVMLYPLHGLNNALGLVQDSVFTGYRSPFILVASMALMVIMSRITFKNIAIIRFIGNYSLGVYLVEGIARKMVLTAIPSLNANIPLFAFFTILVSVGITSLLATNKVTRQLIKI